MGRVEKLQFFGCAKLQFRGFVLLPQNADGKLQFSAVSWPVTRAQDAHRVLVAEDHDLAGILDRAKAAAIHFADEGLAPDIALHVARRATDDLALVGCLERNTSARKASGE